MGADDAPADPAVAREIVLSRALCQFELYRKRPGLEGGALARAARLHASAHGPFAVSDFALYRQPDGIAIWYWDRAKVEGALKGSRPYLSADYRPEGAAPDLDHGVFLLARAEGREAQRWELGTLAASLWRRRPFTAVQWREFAGDDGAVPPVERTLDPFASRPKGRVYAPPEWRTLERAALVGAALCVGAAAFFLGQLATLEVQTAAALSQAVERRASVSATMASNQEVVRAYAQAAPQTGHLAAAADALRALEELGLDPDRWRVTENGFEAYFDGMSAGDMVAAATRLEGVRAVSQVRARRDAAGRTAVLSAAVRVRAGAS